MVFFQVYLEYIQFHLTLSVTPLLSPFFTSIDINILLLVENYRIYYIVTSLLLSRVFYQVLIDNIAPETIVLAHSYILGI